MDGGKFDIQHGKCSGIYATFEKIGTERCNSNRMTPKRQGRLGARTINSRQIRECTVQTHLPFQGVLIPRMHNRIVCLGGVVLSIGFDLAFNTTGVHAMFYRHTKSGDGQSDIRRKLTDRYIACIDNSSTMVGSVVKTNVFVVALTTGPIIGSNGFGIGQVTCQRRRNDFLRPRSNRF